ncbi:MAG: DUF4262 domain-containing protein [Pirellulales bacterium]
MSNDDEIAAAVARHGWQVLSITDAPEPFLYTCGLTTTFSHPELIIFDPAPNAGYLILAAMVEGIRNGRSFAQRGEYDRVLIEGNVAVRDVHPTQHEFYLGCAMGHFRHMGRIGQLKALQVFWPDSKGRFPFQPHCDEDVYMAQPRLDVALPPEEIEDLRGEFGS